LKNYLDGKQIPKECEGEMIITMTERTNNYCQIGICSEAPDFRFEKFFGNSNVDAYFTMLFNTYIVGRKKKYYIAIDSNVWSCLKTAKKVLLKGQFRNRAIIDIVKIDDL
jgi:hypothetical protein